MHNPPPIEDWWPGLPLHLKQQLLRDPEAPLSRAILDEILGESVGAGHVEGYDFIRLTLAERRYLGAQADPVE